MKMLALFMFVFLAACGASENSRQAALMDEIESQVQMPSEAGALDRYSRFYTQAKSGEIVGTYVKSAHDNLPIGRRRWVTDLYHLPAIDDGGCLIVNIVFDPMTKKVTQALCNGIA